MGSFFNLTCKLDPNDEKALIKNLESLGKRSTPVLKKAIRPLANEAKKAIKPLVPKRTGALRKSIKLKPIRSRRFYTVGFRVYFDYVPFKSPPKGKKLTRKQRKLRKKRSKGNFYAMFPEYGVRKGKRLQKSQKFALQGAEIAKGQLGATKQAIADGIVAEWNRK